MEAFVAHWMELSRSAGKSSKQADQPVYALPSTPTEGKSRPATSALVERPKSHKSHPRVRTAPQQGATRVRSVKPGQARGAAAKYVMAQRLPQTAQRRKSLPRSESSEGSSDEREPVALPEWQHVVVPTPRRVELDGAEKNRRVNGYYQWVRQCAAVRGGALPSPNTAPLVGRTPNLFRPPPVLDFSYCNVQDLDMLLNVLPRNGKRNVTPLVPTSTAPVATEATDDDEKQLNRSATLSSPDLGILGRRSAPEPEAPPGCYSAGSLKLENNSLVSLDRWAVVIPELIAMPSRHLTAVDLSFNQLVSLPSDWGSCPLQLLHLHSNHIGSFDEAMKVQCLSSTLVDLTMHGNEITKEKEYRNRLLVLLPRLKRLDFMALTQSDREDADYFRRMVLVPASRNKSRIRRSGAP
eukprot:TRINITY_DN10871_c0_g1_i1.p1 TRINITY_DN10871_c0_g1~~TRINITY_DN10871_c0_g1_i1.p1  ORF type:complete len:409 (-),score=40.57 TRINITY_DN10871_c0_g1_i1:13-1239(-)